MLRATARQQCTTATLQHNKAGSTKRVIKNLEVIKRSIPKILSVTMVSGKNEA